MAKLKLQPAEGDPVEFDLEDEIVSLGRHPYNQIVIGSTFVSAFHARFSRQPDGHTYSVEDLDSYNGTKVNGRSADKEILSHGDILHFGQLVARFEDLEQRAENAQATNEAGPDKSEKSSQNGDAPDFAERDQEESELSAREVELNVLKEQIAKRQVEIAELTASEQRMRAELPELRDKLDQAINERQASGNAIEKQQATLSSLKESDRSMRTELSKLDEELKRSRDELKRSQEAVEKQKAILESMEESRVVLEDACRAVRESTQEREGELQSVGEQLNTESAKLQATREEVKQEAAKLEELVGRTRRMNDGQEALEDTHAKFRDQAVRAEAEAEKLESERDAVRSSLEQAKEELERTRREIEETLDNARSQNAKVIEQTGREDAELKQLEQTVRKLHDEQRLAGQVVEKLRVEEKSLLDKRDRTSTELAELDASATAKREQLKAAQEQLNSLKEDSTGISRALEANRAELASLGSELAAARDEHAKVKSALQKFGDTEAELRQNLVRAKSEFKKLSRDLKLARAEKKKVKGGDGSRSALELDRERAELATMAQRNQNLRELNRKLRASARRWAIVEGHLSEGGNGNGPARHAAAERVLNELMERVAELEEQLEQQDPKSPSVSLPNHRKVDLLPDKSDEVDSGSAAANDVSDKSEDEVAPEPISLSDELVRMGFNLRSAEKPPKN